MLRRLTGFLAVVLGVWMIMVDTEAGIRIILIITGILLCLMGLWFLLYEPLLPKTPKK